MDGLDQEILQSFVEESREHLADVETELLRAEAAEGKTPPEVINQVFRCVHSIKGGAGFLGLERIKELSHQLENVVGLMREGQLVPSPQTITVLLQATDRLRELVEEVEQSNLMEIGPMLAALEGVLAPAPSPEPCGGLPAPPGQVGATPDCTGLQEETATVEVAALGTAKSIFWRRCLPWSWPWRPAGSSIWWSSIPPTTPDFMAKRPLRCCRSSLRPATSWPAAWSPSGPSL